MKKSNDYVDTIVDHQRTKIQMLKRLVEEAYFEGRYSKFDGKRDGQAWTESSIKQKLNNI